MSLCYYNYVRRILLVVAVIIFAILVSSPQFGAACRPFDDGLLLQKLPRSPSKPSSPSPIHPAQTTHR
ncbi:putative transmembrane protein [Sesbania bispinosa]|nr:putative transmembrane protein [Sesbania bispinosa]